MEQRKIQLVAGMTYTLSLPKPWIIKNSLKEGQLLLITEQDNGSLVLSKSISTALSKESISLNINEYSKNIEQILLKLYYLGFETIELFSKELNKETKKKIRATLPSLIGAEIIREEENKIIIRILLDKTKVDVEQSMFRMSLIIEQMILNLLEEIDVQEMILNENETDRLYHLITKMLSLSLSDSSLLQSSKIKNINFIIHYMLIVKRLESIGDHIYWLAKYIAHNKKSLEVQHKKAVTDFLRRELNRSIRHIMADYPAIFSLPSTEEIKRVHDYIHLIKDEKIKEHLNHSVKLVLDNEGEIVLMSFSNQLAKEKII
ncbi:MAG TPA: PhoU domain-containing protein [Candidatus Nanoarchaeia archaeon]|nr:PhoU domain-containing protein [Candidatus Nanoarchaeia archaeon]